MFIRLFRNSVFRILPLVLAAALFLAACGTGTPDEETTLPSTAPTTVPAETEPAPKEVNRSADGHSRCSQAMEAVQSARFVHYTTESYHHGTLTDSAEGWCRGEDFLIRESDGSRTLRVDSSWYSRADGEAWTAGTGGSSPMELRFQPDGDDTYDSALEYPDGSLEIILRGYSWYYTFRWDSAGTFLGYIKSSFDDSGVYAEDVLTILSIGDSAAGDTIDAAFAEVTVPPIVTEENIDCLLGNPDVAEMILYIWDEENIPYEKINTFPNLQSLTINIETGPQTLDMSLLTVQPERIVVKTCISGEYMDYVNLAGVDDLQLYQAYADFTDFPVSPDVRSFTIQYSGAELTDISEALPGLKALLVVGWGDLSTDLAPIAGLEQLQELYLSVPTDECLATLPILPSLTTVTIPERTITNVSPLLAQPNLAALNLEYLDVPENEGLDGAVLTASDDPLFDQLVTNIDKTQLAALLDQGVTIHLTPHNDPMA